MQVADAELGAGHVDGEIDLAPTAQVLDAVASVSNRAGKKKGLKHALAVPTVLRPPRNRPGTLPADPLTDLGARSPGVHVDGLRGLGHVPIQPVGRDQLGLAPVPRRQHLGRRGAAQDARVDQAGELDVRDVARGAEDAFKVPDGFCAVLFASWPVSSTGTLPSHRPSNVGPKAAKQTDAEG